MFDRYPSTVLILCITLLVGCQGVDSQRTPVSEIGQGGRGAYHIVQRGDTLYSIAWRYGFDYKELAAANDIAPPYTIFVDQRIKLVQGRGTSPPRREVSDGPPVDSSRAPAPLATPGSAVTKSLESVQGDGEIAWHWPLNGEVIEGFSLTGKINKGIDIRGEAGDRVRAAGDGVVVYAGGGLRGYGKLVIVKHNDRFLSAYANNHEVLVSEGDKVKAGQVVARIGRSGPDTHMVHFEIRRDGKPEDPLLYLPGR